MRQEMKDMLEHHSDLISGMRSIATTTLPPVETARHAFEAPKVQRPQDRAYQEILTAKKTQQQPEETHTSYNATSQAPNEMMKVDDIRMNNLMSSMGNILNTPKRKTQQSYLNFKAEILNGLNGTNYYEPTYKPEDGSQHSTIPLAQVPMAYSHPILTQT
jgi:hypothetical protein